jgi:RNA-directed DNA polymerase
MLHIRQKKHLLSALDTTAEEVAAVLETPDRYYEELLLTDPAKPDKPRVVVNVTGVMRRLQSRLYRRVLLPKLPPSVYSHGGVRGRSIKTNVESHLGSAFVFKADIRNFYPSIHYRRVYRLFTEQFKCSPDVGSICTKICTYRHHLALGLICSPILADQILSRADRRIGGACEQAGLIYTRFVDDIAISGPYSLEQAGFARIVEEILERDGFHANPKKHIYGSLTDGIAITSLRERRGHLDVRREYVIELMRQLNDAASLSKDGVFAGPYFTSFQILGRVRFVSWVNPGRQRRLLKKYRSISWKAVKRIARRRGLESVRKRLTKLTPDNLPKRSDRKPST